LKNGNPLKTKWFPAGVGQSTQIVDFSIPDTVIYPDAFEIDWPRKTLDLNRKDNFRRTSGLFPE